MPSLLRLLLLYLLAMMHGAVELPSVVAQDSANAGQLQQLLKRFPDADANHDGTLTVAEAQAYRAKQPRDLPRSNSKLNATETNPTHANVHYAPHERNVLDFYQATSDTPTPLIIYIHGGGFVAGDKSSINAAMIHAALEAKISVAALNYRFVNGTDILFPVPQHDCARGVQFLRSQAKPWNIDPERVACFGGSAGAGISMWLGFHNDLADPANSDPIARHSTRLVAIGTMGGQGTYDPIKIKELVGGRAWEHPSIFKVYGVKTADEVLHPSKALRRIFGYPSLNQRGSAAVHDLQRT
jgi:acetyl esterase